MRQRAAAEAVAERHQRAHLSRPDALQRSAQPGRERDVLPGAEQERVEEQLAELPVAHPGLGRPQRLERPDVDEDGERAAELQVVGRRVLQREVLVERGEQQVELQQRGVAQHPRRPLVRIRDEGDALVAQDGGRGRTAQHRLPVRDVDLLRRDESPRGGRVREQPARREGAPVGRAALAERSQHRAVGVEDAAVGVPEGPRVQLRAGRHVRRSRPAARRPAPLPCGCAGTSAPAASTSSADSHGGDAAHEELQDHAAAARVQICKDLRSHVTPVVEESGCPNVASLSIRHRSSTYIPALSLLTAPPGVKTGEEAAGRFLLQARFTGSNLMPMATYASRPAWELRARTVSNARIAAPLGIGVLLAVSVLLRTPELGTGFWIDEGLSVGIADRPLGDIPGVLRQDGSPPLYYTLLHLWLGVAGRSEESVHALSLLFATLDDPGRVLGRLDAVRPPHGVGRGAVDGRQPLPHPIRAGGPHVRARLPAGDAEHDLLAQAFTTGGEGVRRAPAIGFAVAFAAMLYTHNWSIFFGAATGVAWLVLAWRAGGEGAPAAAAHGRARVRRRVRALRALDPDPALPGRPHGCAVVADAGARRARVGAGATGRIAELGRAARRGRGRRGAGAGSRRARPCRLALLLIALLTVVIAWT